MRRGLGVLGLASLLTLGGCGASPEGLEYEPFGRVAVYKPSSSASSSAPAHVAIVISGEAGWRGAVTEVARTLSLDGDALVLGVDLPSYRKTLAAREDTVYASADLEVLSQFAQRRFGMPAYRQPVLVGFQAGGALAYIALAQGNPNTFTGALSLAFCPEVALPQPPGAGRGLAARDEGNGRYRMLPSPLQGRWIVLQGSRDAVCAPRSLEGWPTAIPHAKLVVLDGSDHELAGGRWSPVVREAFLSLAGRASVEDRDGRAADVKDLPLIEVRAAAAAGDLLAVIITGDGGWASIDRDIGNVLAGRGVPVVGLNALRYFWTRRTPEGAAIDLARIGRHYLAAWGRQRLLLIGYSRGADVLPFMVSRLPEDLRRRVELVVLMGPEPTVGFTFHLSDWVGGSSGSSDLPVQPEIEKLRGLRVLCIHGEDERDSVCPRLDRGLATRFALPGGHHFGGDYGAIAARILAEAHGSGGSPS